MCSYLNILFTKLTLKQYNKLIMIFFRLKIQICVKGDISAAQLGDCAKDVHC